MALTKVTKELIQGGLGIDWQATVKTGNFQAVASQGYFVNTTSNQVIVTMPPTASVGDIVSIVDYAGTAQTNNITITAQSNINGSANDVVIDYQRGAVSIIYSGTIQGWVAEFAANDGTDALVTVFPSISTNFLVVGGGGGGGHYVSGGGGGSGGVRTSWPGGSGGGQISENSLSLFSATAYTLTVGTGGVGGVDTSTSGDGTNSSISQSSITDIVSTGGGGGGGYDGSFYAPKTGGSGGGGTYATYMTGASAVTSPLVQGFAGGNAIDFGPSGGGGGGGAGAVGVNASGGPTAGNGGPGKEVNIIGGTGNFYGGGGGGGANAGGNPTLGTGGSGGGGNGAQSDILSGANPINGTLNTGGGGGGAASGDRANPGGQGGSGIVILRYPTADVSSYAVTGTLDTVANTAYPITNTAYYKLNGNANDSSGNGYNGTASNLSPYATGRFGQAAVFNGSNSYIDLPASINTSYFTPSSSWSISIWGNSSSLSGEGMLFGIDPLQNNEILVTGAGKVQWRIYNSSYEYLNSTTTVSINQWYHVVVTYSNGTMKLYVNAVNEASGTKTLVQSTYAPNIGRKQNSSAYFNGSIDQVRIFNSALSAGNVTSLYNEGTVVESTDGTDSILQFIGGTGNITFS